MLVLSMATIGVSSPSHPHSECHGIPCQAQSRETELSLLELEPLYGWDMGVPVEGHWEIPEQSIRPSPVLVPVLWDSSAATVATQGLLCGMESLDILKAVQQTLSQGFPDFLFGGPGRSVYQIL